MDTKSKKFDKSFISKTIAFLLAIIAFAVGVVSVVACAANAEKIYSTGFVLEDYISNFLISGKDFNLKESRSFKEEYSNAVIDAVIGMSTFGDGSREAFEKYQNEKKEYTAEREEIATKEIIKKCLGTSGKGSPVDIVMYLDGEYGDDIISLTKISGHGKHYINGFIEVYGDGEVEYYSDDGDYYYNYYEDNVEYTTFYYGGSDIRNIQSPNEIPESITSQLKKGEYAVEFCKCDVSDLGESFDGYYKLTVDRANLSNLAHQMDIRYSYNFNSYEEFLNGYKNIRKEIAALKNLKIAVADNKTGLVWSNVEQFNGKKLNEKLTKYFGRTDFIDFRSVDFSKGYYGENNFIYSDYINATHGMSENELNGNFDCTVYTAFDSSLESGNDVFTAMRSDYSVAADLFQRTTITCLICLAVILLCIIYLVIRSGRRSGDDELHMMRADKIFTILRTAINAALIVGAGAAVIAISIDVIIEEGIHSPFLYAAVGVLSAVAMALLIDWILFLARHIKNHTLFKNIFIVWLIIKLKKIIKKQKELRKEKPILYQDIMNDVLKKVLLMGFLPNFAVGLTIVLLFAAEVFGLGIFFIFLIFAYDVFLAFYVCRYAYSLREVIKAVNQIRGGDNDIRINTDKMPDAVKSFANDVNTLNEGLKIAVGKAVKEQRMKTELITNVSHDLKTPLTSIINYVDLLSRCEISNETANEYIAVLGEKSARLKKLIEDLVEASKASSGAMKVELISVSLNELSAQLAGEYEEDFEKRNLELICESESDNITVRADSRISYRILDNLMSNVKKYAMPGTRVYLNLSKTAAGGVLTLRNISQNRLNIPVSELLERFVRADESRSTEGSGLGLSIADNLCSLQGAQLELEINGDLFTARVTFPLA